MHCTCNSQQRREVATKARRLRQQLKTAVYKKHADQHTSATDNRRTEEQFRIACEVALTKKSSTRNPRNTSSNTS